MRSRSTEHAFTSHYERARHGRHEFGVAADALSGRDDLGEKITRDAVSCAVTIGSALGMLGTGAGAPLGALALGFGIGKCGYDLATWFAPTTNREEVRAYSGILTPIGFQIFPAIFMGLDGNARSALAITEVANFGQSLFGLRDPDSVFPIFEPVFSGRTLNDAYEAARAEARRQEVTDIGRDLDAFMDAREPSFIGGDPRDIDPPGRGDLSGNNETIIG